MYLPRVLLTLLRSTFYKAVPQEKFLRILALINPFTFLTAAIALLQATTQQKKGSHHLLTRVLPQLQVRATSAIRAVIVKDSSLKTAVQGTSGSYFISALRGARWSRRLVA
jgi:hypothetical protein